MQPLCPLRALPEGSAREFRLAGGQSAFVLHWQGRIRGYLNRCPHAGLPLNMQPELFLNLERTHIQCSNHMALFEPETGYCVSGPCTGASLETLDTAVRDGVICFAQKA